MRRLHVTNEALPRAAFDAIKGALLGSPLVGASTLSGPFRSSRGFAVVFKETGKALVLERFPQLAPHFERALGLPAVRALTPWFSRAQAPANAWYLNVLMVSEGGTVGRHVDATLRQPSGVPDALPLMVSVLYLSVPAAKGGALCLWSGDEAVARVEPKERRLVHFRGDLAHEVCAFSGAPEALRASLVIEQYRFEHAALAQLPDFKLDSRAGFEAYLRAHQAWGPARTLDIER